MAKAVKEYEGVERLGSLMKTKYGVTRAGSLRFTPKDNIYTKFKKLAKYIAKNGDWTVEDEKKAAEIMRRTDYNIPLNSDVVGNTRYEFQVEVVTQDNYPEINESIFNNGHIYLVKEIAHDLETGESQELERLVRFDEKNSLRTKHGGINYNYYDGNQGQRELMISYHYDLDRALGFSRIYQDLQNNLDDLQQNIVEIATKKDYQYPNKLLQNDLIDKINQLNSGNYGRSKYSYYFEIARDYVLSRQDFVESWIKHFKGDASTYSSMYDRVIKRSIPLDVLDTYLNDTYDIVLQHENLRSVEKTSRAREWQTKKNINKATQEVMDNTKLLSHFRFVELDNQVDLDKFRAFEQAAFDLAPVLPRSEQVPELRLRKLGKIKVSGMNASGVYFPGINTIAVDFRDNRVESYVHEFGHYLDFTVNPKESLSMGPEFKEVVHSYRDYLYGSENIKKQNELGYYSMPTEVFARGFEYYLYSELRLKTPLMHTAERYASSPYQPFTNPDLHEKITSYFDNQFPELRQRVADFELAQAAKAKDNEVGQVLENTTEPENEVDEAINSEVSQEKTVTTAEEVSLELNSEATEVESTSKDPMQSESVVNSEVTTMTSESTITSESITAVENESQATETPSNAVEEPYALRRARGKLERLQTERNQAVNQAVEHVMRTNGQPMNDKRNAESYFRREERLDNKAAKLSREVETQQERVEILEEQAKNQAAGFNKNGTGLEMSVQNIPRIRAEIEKYDKGESKFTKQTIERYRRELVDLERIEQRSQVTLTPGAQALVESGRLNQWKKKPSIYFIKGLRKIALEVTDEGNLEFSQQYALRNPKARQVVDELLAQQAEVNKQALSQNQVNSEATKEVSNSLIKSTSEVIESEVNSEAIEASTASAVETSQASNVDSELVSLASSERVLESEVQSTEVVSEPANESITKQTNRSPNQTNSRSARTRNFSKQTQANYEANKKLAKSRNILEVASVLGLDLVRTGRSYSTQQHDSLVFFPQTNTFKWFSVGDQGDPIDLVQSVTGYSFKEAVNFLIQDNFSEQVPNLSNLKRSRNPFEYKLRDHKSFNNGYEFLTNIRGLSPETIDFFRQKGVLTEATRFRKNGIKEPVIVFKAYDRKGKMRGATLQGTRYNAEYGKHGYLKEIVANSDGNYGMTVEIGNPNKIRQIVFCESSIDLMSYYELHKNQLENVALVSMDGLKQNSVLRAVTEYLPKEEPGKRKEKLTLTFAVDNDEKGRRFVELYENKVLKNRGQRNEPRRLKLEIDLPPNSKHAEKADWNDYLKAKKHIPLAKAVVKKAEKEKPDWVKNIDATFFTESQPEPVTKQAQAIAVGESGQEPAQVVTEGHHQTSQVTTASKEGEAEFVPFPKQKRAKKRRYAPPKLPKENKLGSDGFDYRNAPLNEVAKQTTKFIRNYRDNVEGFNQYLEFMAENPDFDYRNVAIIKAMNPDAKVVGSFKKWQQVQGILEAKGFRPDEFLNREVNEKLYAQKRLGILKGTHGLRLLKKKKWFGAFDEKGRPYYVDKKRVMRRSDQLSPLERVKNKDSKGFIKEGPNYSAPDDYEKYHVFTVEQTNLKAEYLPLLQKVWKHRYDYQKPENLLNFQASLEAYAKEYQIAFTPVAPNQLSAEVIGKQVEQVVVGIMTDPRYVGKEVSDKHPHSLDRFKLRTELTSYLVKRHFGLETQIDNNKVKEWVERLDKLQDTKFNETLIKVNQLTRNIVKTVSDQVSTVDVTLDYVKNYKVAHGR